MPFGPTYTKEIPSYDERSQNVIENIRCPLPFDFLLCFHKAAPQAHGNLR